MVVLVVILSKLFFIRVFLELLSTDATRTRFSLEPPLRVNTKRAPDATVEEAVVEDDVVSSASRSFAWLGRKLDGTFMLGLKLENAEEVL